MKWRRPWGPLVLTALTVCGCALSSASGPLAIVQGDLRGTLEAFGGSGRLEITDECVVLTADNGAQTTLVFRAGQVSWDPGARTITFLAQGEPPVTLSSGDRITIGGGTGLVGDPVTEPPASCPDGLFTVHSVAVD